MTQHWRETVIEMVEEEGNHEEIEKKEEKEEGEEKEEKEGRKVVVASGGKSESENDSMEATVQRVGDEMQCTAGNVCQGVGKRGRSEGEVATGAEVL